MGSLPEKNESVGPSEEEMRLQREQARKEKQEEETRIKLQRRRGLLNTSQMGGTTEGTLG